MLSLKLQHWKKVSYFLLKCIMVWRGSTFPSVLVTECFGRKGSEHFRLSPVLKGTESHQGPLRVHHRATTGPPQGSESSWKGQARPSGIPPRKKQVPGISPAEFEWLQDSTALLPSLYLLMAMPGSHWPHLALWFGLFHRERGTVQTAPGHGLSIPAWLGWAQHHRITGHTCWHECTAMPDLQQSSSCNLSCLIHAAITYLFLDGLALVHFLASKQHFSPGKWIIGNNRPAFPKTQEIYRKLHTLLYKQGWYIKIVSSLPVGHQKCLNNVIF